jgi:hypothetical protein
MKLSILPVIAASCAVFLGPLLWAHTPEHAQHAHGSGAGPATVPSDLPKAEYALQNCPISGMRLGGMGPPFVTEIDGREVQFCCGGCVGAFTADKENQFKKMDQAVIARQKPSYPFNECLVSGDELDGHAIDHVYQGWLVRLCCDGCIDELVEDPMPFISKLKQARDAAASEKK